MVDKPRFTLLLTLTDNQRFTEPLHMAIGVDHEVRISQRAVDEMKLSTELGVSLVSMDQAVELMRIREFRKDLFTQAAMKLGTAMAERMEDAEGWHDTSRIEPARAELGGTWDK